MQLTVWYCLVSKNFNRGYMYSCYVNEFFIAHRLPSHSQAFSTFFIKFLRCHSYRSFAVKRQHNQGNSYKWKCLIGGLLCFRGRDDGDIHSGMVLEKQPKALQTDPPAPGRKGTDTGTGKGFGNLKA